MFHSEGANRHFGGLAPLAHVWRSHYTRSAGAAVAILSLAPRSVPHEHMTPILSLSPLT